MSPGGGWLQAGTGAPPQDDEPGAHESTETGAPGPSGSLRGGNGVGLARLQQEMTGPVQAWSVFRPPAKTGQCIQPRLSGEPSGWANQRTWLVPPQPTPWVWVATAPLNVVSADW